jgi:hypothetical protein
MDATILAKEVAKAVVRVHAQTPVPTFVAMVVAAAAATQP